MSITHREFLRLLPRAVHGHPYNVEGNTVSIQIGDGRLIIKLDNEGEKRIASLTLPSTRLEFSFERLNEEERKAFLGRFDRAYQRGGG